MSGWSANRKLSGCCRKIPISLIDPVPECRRRASCVNLRACWTRFYCPPLFLCCPYLRPSRSLGRCDPLPAQDFFAHAVVALTEAGKKREIYEGNLIAQHRALLQKLETVDVNPQLKLKGRRQHTDQTAYPPRVLVELLVNMLVHRDYQVPEPSSIELHPGSEIVFSNPGALTQKVAGKVTLENDGRIILSVGVTDQRNPSLCDIFFGISAMERAGTGLIDVGELMLKGGGASAFYHSPADARFKAIVAQPMASAGSRSVARSDVPTGLYVLNVLPFSAVPEKVSIVKLTAPLRDRPRTIDLGQCGTFVDRGTELWSFVPLPILTTLLEPIVDETGSKSKPRAEIEASQDSKRVLSWLLRKHFEYELLTFEEQDGLILEHGSKHRAYFSGKNKAERTIVWNSAQRGGNRREVVKRRADPPRAWFENEGFGYEIVDMGGTWCVRVKPFYMFTGPDAFTPLPAFTRAAKATRRIKFDRNKSVEADLTFWASFLGRGGETMNVGDLPYLGGRAFFLAVHSSLLQHRFMPDHRRAAWAGESDQAVMVDIVVREIDWRLIATAVMPVEIARPDERDHHIQQALESLRSSTFFVRRVFLFISGGEECGRRQLLVITCDDYLLAAQNGRNSVLRQHLVGLVEDAYSWDSLSRSKMPRAMVPIARR